MQLYRGGKFTWRKNTQYHKRTTHQSPVIDKRQHQIASSKHRHGRNRTHNFSEERPPFDIFPINMRLQTRWP